jgi:hypothetical protein
MTRMGRSPLPKEQDKSVDGRTEAEIAEKDSAVPSLGTRVALEEQSVNDGNRYQSGDAETGAGQDKLDGLSFGRNTGVGQTKDGSDMAGGNAGQKSRKMNQLSWSSAGTIE